MHQRQTKNSKSFLKTTAAADLDGLAGDEVSVGGAKGQDHVGFLGKGLPPNIPDCLYLA